MSAMVKRLCREAKILSDGAQRACDAGDMEAFTDLITAAAQRTQLARQFERMTRYSARAAQSKGDER